MSMSIKGIELKKGDYIISTSEITIAMMFGVPPEIIPVGSIYEIVSTTPWGKGGGKYHIEKLKSIDGNYNLSPYILYNFYIDCFEKYNRIQNINS